MINLFLKQGKVIGFVLSFLVVSCGFSLADGGTKDELTQKLIKRVEELEKKVDYLNNKLKVYEDVTPSSIPEQVIQKKVEDILIQREAKEGGLVKALKDISLSGFIDTSYTYNFNRPDSRTNTARVFDTEANNFNVHAAEVVLERLPPDSGGVGFRTDLYFGEDANLFGPSTTNRTDEFDLEQAYISLRPSAVCSLPFGCWEWIKIGKFVTMHGAEVIEAKDNWNFTRSLLFGYAIPFTHTGVRAGYQLSDKLKGYVGLNNGWDNIKDNNKTKSVEAALAWGPADWVSFNLAGMYGPEKDSNDHSQRGLVDFLATYKPFDKWTFMLNADYGHEEKELAAEGTDTSWSGAAAYAKYDVNSWLSLVSRTEFMSDQQGARISPGTSQDIWETTFTLELRPYKDLITRLEYRHDESSSKIFTDNQKSVVHQDTIGLEAIYLF